MTNYEKYQETIIDLIVDNIDICEELLKIKTHNPHTVCPAENFNDEVCILCARRIKEWLLKEVNKIDWDTLEPGTKIEMTRKDTGARFISTLIYHDSDYLWLRCEDNFPHEDENVLMYISDLEERFEDFKVVDDEDLC